MENLLQNKAESLSTLLLRTDWSKSQKTVHVPSNLESNSFQIKGTGNTIRVIGLIPGQLFTEELHLQPKMKGEFIVANSSADILKLAVIERHHNTGNIGLGFVKGFNFKGGAIASTVGHDAHNIAIVGDNDEDMYIAAQTLQLIGGGQCVVSNTKVIARLPLPIAGLMSDAEPDVVIDQQNSVLSAVASLGCTLDDPFMPLSFLPLSVIPKLKLTDLGLIDVDQFSIVPLEVCLT